MNAYIPYIDKLISNELKCLPSSALNDYILTESEQQYIDSLTDDTTTTISTLLLTAATKAGSSLCQQQSLDKSYARCDDIRYNATNRNDFKLFLCTKLVGNDVVEFKELE